MAKRVAYCGPFCIFCCILLYFEIIFRLLFQNDFRNKVLDMNEHNAIMNANSTPHASPAHDSEADQAGSCFFPLKNPLSTSQLADILIDKGLVVESKEDLVTVLETKGYYRLHGYWMTLEKNERFPPGTELDNILQIESFDSELSQYLFAAIAPIEICLRSQLSTKLACHYGSRALHVPEAFLNQNAFERLQESLKKETKQAIASKKTLVLLDMRKYGELAAWSEIENTSLGTLSKIYGNLADANIAAEAASIFNIPWTYLKNWLRYLTQIRNVCAHHDRLYNRLFCIKPRMFREHSGVDAARLFPTFIVLFRLHDSLDPARCDLLRQELGRIIDTHATVDLGPIGFPENWREILRIPEPREHDIVRPRGRQGGRPLKNAASIERALYKYDMRESSVAEIAKECGLSLSTLYKYIHLREDAKNRARTEYTAVNLSER